MSDYTLRDFVKLDTQEVLEGAVGAFEEEYKKITGTPITLYPGDERRMVIAGFMYLCETMAGIINYRANQNLIQNCDGEILELKGEERHVERIQPKRATVRVRFGMEKEQTENILIEKGKRVTPDGKLFFAVEESTSIPAGEISVEAVCVAVETGSSYNGLAKGQINTLADNIPYVTSVSNTGESRGGTDLEDLEAYRERVLLAPFSYNTAGAYMAYKYNAEKADESIIDVEPVENDTEVEVYVLCENGEAPTEEILEKVRESLSKGSVRPLTDKVSVKPAKEVSYAVGVSYRIGADEEDRATEIQAKVLKAVRTYIETLKKELGKSINPEILKRDMYNAGAASVTVTEPAYRALNRTEVAKCDAEPTIIYEGIM